MRSCHVLLIALLVLEAWAWAEEPGPQEQTPPKETPAPKPAEEEKRPSYKGFKGNKVDLLVDYHLNVKGNAIGNAADLGKSRDLDFDGKPDRDEVQYVSYGWDVKLDLKYDGFFEYFLGVDSDGPMEFAAPLVGTHRIQTIFGSVDYYRHEELLPQIDETWVDLFDPKWPVGLKMGLFRYDLTNGITTPGFYANYGATIHGAFPKGEWGLHYHRPDLNRDAHPYAHNEQEERLLVGGDDVDAHYLSGNVKYQPLDLFSVQPYVHVLLDNTAARDRRSLGPPAGATYDRDLLGIAGADFNFKLSKKWSVGFEAATNFGQADGTNGTRDLQHRGYMFYADATYLANEKLTARFKACYLSGQKHQKGDLADGDIYDGKDTEFMIYSPTNTLRLFDTQYPSNCGPVLSSAGGSALQFGVPRPGSNGDPFPHVNQLMVDLGVDWKPLKKLTTTWDVWLLRSNEPGFGTWQGRTFALPHFLGAELDSNITYQVTDHLAVNLLSALFLPGSYYRQKRDDTPIYSYTARMDGHASPAYQFELGFDLKF
jgi:hypothetical protein